MERLYGNHRALVTENKDPEKYGRVKIWIPELMPTLEPTPEKSIWANPANNPLGGRNEEASDKDHHYMGSSYIPKKGSWVWVFFEGGNINRPYYWGSVDIQNTKVLPENQLGDEYEHKWTILKTHTGRIIIMSDDPHDERVEITGKKRKLPNTEPPTGAASEDVVYAIDDNQTVILFDERAGKEKVLIRTHKGDFLHIDIDEQKLQAFFKDEIHIETEASFYLKAKEDIHILAEGNIFEEAKNNIDIKAGSNITEEAGSKIDQKAGSSFNMQSGSDTNIKSGADINEQADGGINQKSSDAIQSQAAAGIDLKAGMMARITGGASAHVRGGAMAAIDGPMKFDQCGVSVPAGGAGGASSADSAEAATPATPEGERDT